MMDRPEAARPQSPRVRQVRPAADRVAALEEQVAALTEALNEARARIAKLEGVPPPAPIRVRPRPLAQAGNVTPAIRSCSA